MTALPRFDDFAALQAIAARGFDPWNAPVVITPDQVADFCRLTGVQAVANEVPGALLQSMLPVLAPERGWAVRGYAGAVNLGSPEIRFPVVARCGSRVAGRSRLVEAASHPRGAVLTIEYEAREVDVDQPCLRSRVQLLYIGGAA